jgi:predicted O-methyltransferase YrrM
MLGAKPLWEGYAESGAERSAHEVGTMPSAGAFYSWLVVERDAATVVEFGTAFGFSGMYFLGGLEQLGAGKLFTFEPNGEWRRIAQQNLARVSGRFVSVEGTFEDNLATLGDARIDVAFIDAIHTSAFVKPQFEIIAQRLSPGGIVLLDDITFSDDMAACWQELSSDERVAGAVELDGRIGVLELKP